MPADIIERYNEALIQHGPENNRIYLIKIGSADPAVLIPALEQLAQEKGYTKIFAKIPESAGGVFLGSGYKKEGFIPGFYNGEEGALFLGRFLSTARQEPENKEKLEEVLKIAKAKRGTTLSKKINAVFTLRLCTAKDAERMSEIYKIVFPSYPFPIHDPAYLEKTMRTHIDYFGVEHKGQLAAIASAEMDKEKKNVEMTDFATLPEWRGYSLALHLLDRMEASMRAKEFKTAYTIARAVSPGMNITFAKMGYQYGGLLVNNTNICGAIESMNIWHKPL